MRRYDIRFEHEDIIVSDWLETFPVRFVYYEGEWWAVLKDVCDALGVRVDNMSCRIDPYDLLLADIPVSNHYNVGVRSRGSNPYRNMYIVNQSGILDVVNRSRSDAARKFRYWAKHIFTQLRKDAGLKGYEIDKLMFNREVQREVEERYGWEPIDDTYYDEEHDRVCMMRTDERGDALDSYDDEEYYR